MPRILFVSGFHPSTRARDLAYEFERFGRLVRCDVPAPRNSSGSSPYAFIEFRSERDAEDAYYDMHGRQFEGYRLSVQWAKNPPSSVWRFEKGSNRRSPPRERKRSSRSRSPRRDKGAENGSSKDAGGKDDTRRRSRSPRRDDRGERDERRRSRSRERGRDGERERDRDDKRKRSISPRGKTPVRDDDKDIVGNDRAQTPPYDVV